MSVRRPQGCSGTVAGRLPVVEGRHDQAWERVGCHLGVTAEKIDRRSQDVRQATLARLGTINSCAGNSRVREFKVPGAGLRGVLNARLTRTPKTVVAFSRGSSDGHPARQPSGLEVASAAAQRGLQPRIIEASDRLLSRLVPRPVADRLAQTHQAAGVSLTYGTMVQRFISNGHGALKRAVLTNGEVVDCDLALVAVGGGRDCSSRPDSPSTWAS